MKSRLLLMLTTVAAVGCGSDPIADNPLPDAADAGGDSSADIVDACSGVDCGINGRCVVAGALATCQCDVGFSPVELGCVADNRAPVITNLPATESGQARAEDSLTTMADDPDGDSLHWSLGETTCDFTPVIDAAGLVSWTCEAPGACTVKVLVSDDQEPPLSATGDLTIECLNTPPTFLSAPQAVADEETTLEYLVVCTDPDGEALTLTLGEGDTCGGTLTDSGEGQGDYNLELDETRGGSECTIDVRCADAEDAQS